MYNFRPGRLPTQHICGARGTPEIAPWQPRVVSDDQPVSLLRRLGAMCYDSLLLVAVLFLAGLPLPLIPEAVRFNPWVRYGILLYMLLVSFIFFGWFWTHGGQTLGMRAWRFRVVTADRGLLTWRLAWRRFAWSMVSWAFAGAGFVWSLFDNRSRAWHDHFSGTHLLRTASRSVATQKHRPDPQEHQGR